MTASRPRPGDLIVDRYSYEPFPRVGVVLKHGIGWYSVLWSDGSMDGYSETYCSSYFRVVQRWGVLDDDPV